MCLAPFADSPSRLIAPPDHAIELMGRWVASGGMSGAPPATNDRAQPIDLIRSSGMNILESRREPPAPRLISRFGKLPTGVRISDARRVAPSSLPERPMRRGLAS